MSQSVPFEASDTPSLTIKNTFIDLDKSARKTGMPRSTSLPADMSSLETLEGLEKAHTEQRQDSDVATDAGADDVIASDSSHFGAESEADNCNSSLASGAAGAAVSWTARTPLSSKARSWQPDNEQQQHWGFDPLQCIPCHQLPFYDSLPFEFGQDARNIVMSISQACERRRAVAKVDTFPAADGGWDVFVHVDDLRAAKKLLDTTMDSLLDKAEASVCTYVLGCEGKPFYISAGGLCFTAYLAAMRDEDQACRSMYDHGFCHGPCDREHPPCMLRLTVTALDSSNPFGLQ
mmetsp:Transcript_114924/g.199155  ORF Transcript_114924/g.199155 Transcript_114924/m.199155 type:complete len:291 (+) Transcript_114924:79-951(+)